MSAKDRILAKLRGSLVGTTPVADDYDAGLLTEPWLNEDPPMGGIVMARHS